MEDYGYKYFPKLPQFVTTLTSGKNCSNDLKTKDVQASEFLSILYNESLLENGKPIFKVGVRVCISKYDLPFLTSYESQLTLKFFRNCWDCY